MVARTVQLVHDKYDGGAPSLNLDPERRAASADSEATFYVEFEGGTQAGEPVKVYRADGYHYAVNPETALEAVFLDGERLPEWAIPTEPDPESAPSE